jgi:hypothetical protein
MSKLPRFCLATTLLGALSSLHCGDASSTDPGESAGQGVSAVNFSGPIHPQASSNLCLDVVGQGTANGTAVQVWSCTGKSNQQWTYNGTTLGVYGSKCLDVTGGSTSSGTKLQIWDCAAKDANQMWAASGATFQWKGKGKCMDLANGVAANGARVQSSTCQGGDTSQEWSEASKPGDGGLGGTTNGLGTITGSPAIAQLRAMTKECTAANKIASDPGDFVLDNGTVSHVCSLKGGPGNSGGAIFFNADMDIDCDGLETTHCPGTGANKDPSWDNATSFAGPNSAKNAKGEPALASENTPYVVIPEEVVYPGLDQNNGGNIVAVIYNDQIEFAVFGDQIAAEPGEKGEDIGEASVRTAVGLGIPSSPATGGVGGGVTYIAFVGTGSKPADMENIAEIQSLGAQLLASLLNNNP